MTASSIGKIMKLAILFSVAFGLLNTSASSKELYFRAKILDECIRESVVDLLQDKNIWYERSNDFFVVHNEDKEEFMIVAKNGSEKCKPSGLTRCYEDDLLIRLKELLNNNDIQYVVSIDEDGDCFVFSPEDMDAVDALELKAIKEVHGFTGEIQHIELD